MNKMKSHWDLMMELIRSSVLERSPIIPRDVVVDWDKLMDLASEQSVIPWVWDGICRLPQEQQPSRMHRINWSLSSQECVNTYYQQKEVLHQIVNVCRQNEMRVLLLKGIGLSELYSKPPLRTCNDIDIFLFDDYEKGNSLFCDGEYTFGVGDKHANFKYQGIVVENHKTIINTNSVQQRRAESYIESTLADVELTDDGYYVLPPMANVIFLLMHALSHMESKIYITIRQIVDFGFLLYKSRDRIDPSECKRILHRLKLEKQFELLLSISEELLGIDYTLYHEYLIPKNDVQCAIEMILDKNTSIDVSYNLPILEQIKLRKAYYKKMSWKYKYIPFSKYNSFMRIYKPPITHLVKQFLYRH